MIAYLDSSVLLRIVLGQRNALGDWSRISQGVASALVEVECLRTLDRLCLTGEHGDEAIATRREAVYRLLESIDVVEISQPILSRASLPLPTVLGTLDDPKLPSDSIDLAIMVDVYHEFSQPQKMLQHLRDALKPTGRLVLLEYRAEDPNVPIRPEHKMTKAQVKLEVEHEGFKQSRVFDDLPWQHLFIFTKAS